MRMSVWDVDIGCLGSSYMMLSVSFSDALRTGATAGRKALAVAAAAWAVMAASVTSPVEVRSPLASPALAVKSGRQRGLSVLDRRRLEMESIAAADAEQLQQSGRRNANFQRMQCWIPPCQMV